MESLELPQDILWDGDQSPTLSPAHLSDANGEQILIFEDCFATGKPLFLTVDDREKNEIVICNFYLTELLPNDDDDFIKPNQNIQFSPEEFEQLLDIQQDLLNNMVEEEQSSGKQILRFNVRSKQCS